MEKDSLIDKYISGELTTEEKDQFNNWMKDDPKFKSDVTFRKDLAAAAFAHETTELKQRLEVVERKGKSSGKSKLRRIIFIVLGVLMIAAAIIGYNLEKMSKSPEGIYASNYETYPNVFHPVTRGNSDVLTKAFIAYESENYEQAAELLGERIKTSNAHALKFYQAMSYGEMGNFPLAIKNLENIRRFDTPYITDSYWYLGLYYIKQGNKAAAVERLQIFYELSKDEKKKKTAAEIIYLLQG